MIEDCNDSLETITGLSNEEREIVDGKRYTENC